MKIPVTWIMPFPHGWGEKKLDKPSIHIKQLFEILHRASWSAGASQQIFYVPSLLSNCLSLQSAVGGKGERHRCYWLQATPLFNTLNTNRMQPRSGRRPAHLLPPYELWAACRVGFVWRGHVWKAAWRKQKLRCKACGVNVGVSGRDTWSVARLLSNWK